MAEEENRLVLESRLTQEKEETEEAETEGLTKKGLLSFFVFLFFGGVFPTYVSYLCAFTYFLFLFSFHLYKSVINI